MADSERLRRFIKDQGMTQEQFSVRIGMRRETISRFVTGSEPITPSFIGNFFLAFGASETEAVFGDEDQPTATEAIS